MLLDPLSDVSDEAKRVDSESPRVVVTFRFQSGSGSYT